MKRLLSMDILRGWAILLMVIFHVFLNVADLVRKAGNLASISIGELILIATIGIFVHWQSLFMMISAIVHWFTMAKMLENGKSMKSILKKQLIFGLALFIFGFLREPFLSPWGITQNWLLTENFSLDRWYFIYRAETISNIGLSVIISSQIFFFLNKISKTNWTVTKQLIVKIIILGALASLFIFLAPTIQTLVNTIAGVNLQVSDRYMHTGLENNGGYYTRWLLNAIAGREFPLFPNFGYFLVGCIIGMLLSQPQPPKKLVLSLSLTGIILTLGGAVYWLFVDNFLTTLDVTFHIHPTGFVIFSLGLQLLIIALFLRIYEFNPRMHDENVRARKLKNSRWIRRWGIFALTIYVFNILEFVPRLIFNALLPSVEFRLLNDAPLPWTIFMIFIVVLMWEGVIRLLDKFKGKGSMEWVFLKLFKRGKSSTPEDPIKLKGILYEVEPIILIQAQNVETKE